MKVGFAKFDLIAKSILKENSLVDSEPLVSGEGDGGNDEWEEYLESLDNERQFGVFAPNSEMEKIKAKRKEIDEKNEYIQEVWNRVRAECDALNQSQEVVFIRADNYMSIAQTLRKMNFYNNEEYVKVIHAFPVKAGLLEEINKSHSVEFKIVTPPEGYKVYSLNWDDANRFTRGLDCDLKIEEYSESHAALWVPEERYCWCGCGDWDWTSASYLMTHQVVFSPCQLTHVN